MTMTTKPSPNYEVALRKYQHGVLVEIYNMNTSDQRPTAKLAVTDDVEVHFHYNQDPQLDIYIESTGVLVVEYEDPNDGSLYSLLRMPPNAILNAFTY